MSVCGSQLHPTELSQFGAGGPTYMVPSAVSVKATLSL